MARIRTIKPEFWKHEDLSALPEPTHMLAAALLNHADDEGYFNANPGLVRAECCPLREPSVSVQDSLNSLVKVGYLELFNGSDGKRYGRIVTFDDHQRVNRPTPSKIKLLRTITDSSVSAHGAITDSSPPERKGKEQGKEGKGEQPSSPGKPADTPPDNCPHSEIVAAYHRALPSLTRVREWTPARQDLLRSRWRENPERQSVVWWEEFFAYVGKCDFLMGRVHTRDGTFECDLEWLVKPKNLLKVLEGKYENKAAA